MVASHPTIQTQNANKCPHGLPVGTCPICSGMGSGGIPKDKNKPRKAGEMSYNECMAEWIRMQRAENKKEQIKQEKLELAQLKELLNKAILGLDKINKTFDKAIENLNQMPKIVALPIKIVINVIIKPILNLINKIPQIINAIQNIFNNIKSFILSVGEKLASVYGEIKNFIDSKIAQPLKKRIKTILAFFTQSQEEENEEVEKLKSREIKKILKSLFRIKNKEEEQQK